MYVLGMFSASMSLAETVQQSQHASDRPPSARRVGLLRRDSASWTVRAEVSEVEKQISLNDMLAGQTNVLGPAA